MRVPNTPSSARPNVLLILDSFDIGGAEGQILLLARLLLEEGRYRPHLAALRRNGPLLAEAEKMGLPAIPEFPLTSFYDQNMVKQLMRFRDFVRERNIEVVHTEGFYTNVFGITGAAFARVPGRVAFRGEITGWRTPSQDLIERQVFRFASIIHANSKAVKEYLVRRGVRDKKIAVVHNGLDLDRITVSAQLTRAEALSNVGLPMSLPFKVITIVANMKHDVKDYPMFLRAAREVLNSVPDAVFVMAGDGDQRSTFESLAKSLDIQNNCYFIGVCSQIPQLLYASDICVLSSKAEGFSNSILEYMGASRPVVATSVGGAPEQIEEGGSGFLVPSGDYKLMGERITYLLQNPQAARQMGKRGRELVEQKFSAAVQLDRTQQLYDRVLNKRPAGVTS
jgi:glycosyltransferase involved in cell wall biosynthesis